MPSAEIGPRHHIPENGSHRIGLCTSLRSPLVSPGFGGCASAGGSRQRVHSLEIRGTPDIGRRARCKTPMV
jgi:hypothetical protein